MKQVTMGRRRLRCDPEATRGAYSSFPSEWRTETCGCCYCRNFVAARAEVYSAEVCTLLENLGIDSTKEAEVYQLCRLESGFYLYGGWFHFVGRIEEEAEGVGEFDLEGVNGPFTIYIGNKPALVPETFRGLPLVQLDFSVGVPWILREAAPE